VHAFAAGVRVSEEAGYTGERRTSTAGKGGGKGKKKNYRRKREKGKRKSGWGAYLSSAERIVVAQWVKVMG